MRSKTWHRTSRNETNPEVRSVIENVLTTLREHGSKIQWIGSRSTDMIRLEATFDGLIVRYICIVSKDHDDFEPTHGIQSFMSGQRDTEMQLKLTDFARRWGRKEVIGETFLPDNALYKNVFDTFKFLAANVEIKSQAFTHAELTYAQGIDAFAKHLISQ